MQARGIVANIGARVFWGAATYYFSLSSMTDARSLFAFRVFWAFAFSLIVCLALGQRTVLLRSVRDLHSFWVSVLASLLIASNWFVVIRSVTDGDLVTTSLGFYVSPLLTVGCGIVLLGERFNAGVVLSLALCAAAVMLLFRHAASTPWPVLYIAATSTAYAYLRKLRPLPTVVANTIETGVATLVAPMLFAAASGGIWLPATHGDSVPYLAGLGVVTTLPMLLYVYSLDKIPLALTGYLQYVTPTLMIAVGALVLHEPIGASKSAAIGLIWVSVIVWFVSKQAPFGRLSRQEIK